MPHDTALIITLAVGFGHAFVLGLVAARLTVPPDDQLRRPREGRRDHQFGA